MNIILIVKLDVICISDLIKPDLLDELKGAIIYEYEANGNTFQFGHTQHDEIDGPGLNQTSSSIGPYEKHLPNELSAPGPSVLYSEHHTSKIKLKFVHQKFCYRENLKSSTILRTHFSPQQ